MCGGAIYYCTLCRGIRLTGSCHSRLSVVCAGLPTSKAGWCCVWKHEAPTRMGLYFVAVDAVHHAAPSGVVLVGLLLHGGCDHVTCNVTYM